MGLVDHLRSALLSSLAEEQMALCLSENLTIFPGSVTIMLLWQVQPFALLFELTRNSSYQCSVTSERARPVRKNVTGKPTKQLMVPVEIHYNRFNVAFQVHFSIHSFWWFWI